MARIAYAEFDQLEPDAAALLSSIQNALDATTGAEMKDESVPYVFRALVHSPKMLEAIWGLLGALWNGTELDRHLQELVILRVAQVRRSNYEWGRHRKASQLMGIPDEKIDALERWQSAPELTPAERAAVGLAESLARDGDAPQSQIDEVLRHFSDRQLVELTLLAATYTMVSIFLATIRVDQEDGDPVLPPSDGGV